MVSVAVGRPFFPGSVDTTASSLAKGKDTGRGNWWCSAESRARRSAGNHASLLIDSSSVVTVTR